MVHFAQNEHIEVNEVARQEERDDLAPSVLHLLVTASPTGEEDVDVLGRLALAHDILARAELTNARGRQSFQRRFVFGRQPGVEFKLSNERIHKTPAPISLT